MPPLRKSGLVEFAHVAETPLPAALPLFAGGIGLVGLLARRGKQRAPARLQ